LLVVSSISISLSCLDHYRLVDWPIYFPFLLTCCVPLIFYFYMYRCYHYSSFLFMLSLVLLPVTGIHVRGKSNCQPLVWL
jgi:hypothetical protein